MELTKEQEIIKLVTEAVQAADEHFEKVGGSSRHWVRDCFLPELKERGLEIVKTSAQQAVGADARIGGVEGSEETK